VVIAVKPHAVVDVLQDVVSVVHANHLIISVAAGFLTAHIERVILNIYRQFIVLNVLWLLPHQLCLRQLSDRDSSLNKLLQKLFCKFL